MVNTRDAVKEVFCLGADLGNQAVSYIQTFHSTCRGDSAYKTATFAFFIKAFKTYRAAELLCRRGFEEDAFVLTRTIFELALQALYVGKAPWRHGVLFVKFDPVYRYRYYTKLKRLGMSDLVSHIDKEHVGMSETKQDHDQWAGAFPEKCNHWWGHDVAWLATECALDLEYRTIYWMQSNLVHSGVTSINTYLTESGGPHTFDVRLEPEVTHIKFSMTATTNFLRIVRCLGTALSPSLLKAADKTEAEIVKVVDTWRMGQDNHKPKGA